MLEWIQYALLGLLQGITEPLPISSSGHLYMARLLFNIGETDVFFEVMMHFASLFAVILVFKDKIIALIQGAYRALFKGSEDKAALHYIGLILIGSLPVGVLGLTVASPLESLLASSGLLVIGAALLVTGTFLWIVRPLTLTNETDTLTVKDAMVIGLFQAVAILPGISRSGSTLVGGLFLKISVRTIIEFSFMLYIPVTLGVSLLELLTLDATDLPLGPLSLAFVMSFIATYVALKIFRSLATEGRLRGFAVYCVSVGLLAVILFFV